jgi:hypothetical protein
MKHQEIYRVAHETATAELTEITAEFDRLRARKELVERLITVLKPVIGIEENPPAAALKEESSPDIEKAAAPATSEENAQRLGVGADPFQRRMDHVLGIGAGIRDVRQYTRQF